MPNPIKTRAVADLPGITEYPVGDGDWDSNRTYPITKVVIHTEVGFKLGTEKLFVTPQSHVSAHYGVNEDGTYDHYVDETNVAFHAGNYATNQCSIGIEHEDFNKPNSPRPDVQYEASAQLVYNICKFWNIPIDRVHIIKHSEVPYATGCPDALDIDRIVARAAELAKLGIAPPPAPITDYDKNSLSVLHSAFPTFTDGGNKPFGNLEGMTREVIGAYPRYKSLTQADPQGHVPVVLSSSQFTDLNIKAKNLDKIAAYLGDTDMQTIDPSYSETIINHLKLLGGETSVPSPAPQIENSDSLSNVFSDGVLPGGSAPSGKNFKLVSIPNPFQLFKNLYAKLFIPQNP